MLVVACRWESWTSPAYAHLHIDGEVHKRLAADCGVSHHAERIIELTGGHPGFVVEALE